MGVGTCCVYEPSMVVLLLADGVALPLISPHLITLFPFYYNIYYYIFVATLSQPYYHHADGLALSLVDWIIMLRVEEDATEEEEEALRRITVY